MPAGSGPAGLQPFCPPREILLFQSHIPGLIVPANVNTLVATIWYNTIIIIVIIVLLNCNKNNKNKAIIIIILIFIIK